jgi:hypothetical protein
MSDSEPTTTVPAVEPPTEEIFVDRPGGAVATETAPAGSGAPPWEGAAVDDDEWPDRGPRKGIRLSVPSVALLGLLIAAGGIWGGAALQRSHGTTTGSSSASSLASLFRSRGGAASLFGGGTGTTAGGATTGTVTEVSGSTLYVTNSSGDLVKVTVGPTATVDRNAASSLASLQVGDTVVVEGTKASNGSVSATSVSASAAGVTASRFGGFTGGAATGG